MNTLKKRKIILNEKMYKVILLLAMPIMFNNIIQMLYNLTDTYFLSKLGATEVASMTLVWPVIFMQLAIGTGIGVAGTTLIAQNIGANNLKVAKKVGGQVLIFTILFSILLAVIGFLGAPYLIRMMGAKGLIYTNGLSYLTYIVGGAPLMYINFAYTAIKQGEADTVSPMILSFISVTINIVLDPIFIFYFDMGIKGAAIATLLARFLILWYPIYQLFIKDTGLKMKLNDLKLNFIYIKKIIKFGIPASISQATVAIGFIILNSFVNTYGEFTLAAFGIGNMISSIIIMPAMGIGGAVSAIVGQNIGNNNIIRAKECVYKSSILGIIISIVGTIILFGGAEKIVGMFSEQKEILELGTTYLKFTSLSIIGLAISPIITGAFQGAGQIKKAMYLNMFRLWGLRLPLLFILPYFIGKSETVIWSAMTSSNLITMFICLYFYKRSNFQPVNKTLLIKC